MGEAKRRKKLMGEDYGKKRQRIVKGTDELSDRLDQLGDDWYGQIEKVLGDPPNFAMPFQEFRSGKKLCQQWLREYLEEYAPETRHKLADEFLMELYGDLYETFEDLKSDPEDQSLVAYLVNLSIQSMFNYSCFKEFLESEDNDYYQEATRVVYESLWEHSLEESEIIEEKEDINITEAIKSIIQDCLEPSENFPDTSQRTPKEITLTNQHETLFYE